MRERELQARVTRLRQIIAEAIPAEPAKTFQEEDAWQRYQQFAANDPLPAQDISPRAIAVRTINRIATSYGWISEIQRFLDRHRASSISALDDDQVDALLERMCALEDCMHAGCDPPDMPAAR